jgi:hypothetical protein
LKSFKNLRKLDFNIEIDNLNELLVVLNLLENVFAKKTMKVTGTITIIQDPHGSDEKGTLDIFRRALEFFTLPKGVFIVKVTGCMPIFISQSISLEA